jgi:coatomer subunit gamma
MQPSEDCGLVEDFIIPIPSLASSTGPETVYVSFTRENPSIYAVGSFPCTLKFVAKEVDPTSGEPEEEGYPDEYGCEEIELGAADYIVPSYATFASEWERLKAGPGQTEVFALSSSESIKGVLGARLLSLSSPSPLSSLLSADTLFLFPASGL